MCAVAASSILSWPWRDSDVSVCFPAPIGAAMETAALEARLWNAVKPHDLLCHPFYRAWSAGSLTVEDLRCYAAQYQHQVAALPALLNRAVEWASDAPTRQALQRNLAEETGATGTAHAKLWRDFASELGVHSPADADLETKESAARLSAAVGRSELEALAVLWAYEFQTARVARTKREGLTAHYAVSSKRALAFFELHESLDIDHAADLLSALARLCGDDADRLALACEAASDSARAQWRFLDGAERARAA
jgi:pyrroloquinoline-quinone synthase